MIVEFTISDGYLNSFITRIKEIPFLKITRNVDPSMPTDPEASVDTFRVIKNAFINRIQALSY
jgi:hypothetical protein